MYIQSPHYLKTKQILPVKSQSNQLWAAISNLSCELWAKRSDVADIRRKRNEGNENNDEETSGTRIFLLVFSRQGLEGGKAFQFVPSHSRTLTTRRSLATLPTAAAPWHNRSTGKKPSIDKLKGFISLAIVAGNTLIHRSTLPQALRLPYIQKDNSPNTEPGGTISVIAPRSSADLDLHDNVMERRCQMSLSYQKPVAVIPWPQELNKT